jgi:hypothetical protein
MDDVCQSPTLGRAAVPAEDLAHPTGMSSSILACEYRQYQESHLDPRSLGPTRSHEPHIRLCGDSFGALAQGLGGPGLPVVQAPSGRLSLA